MKVVVAGIIGEDGDHFCVATPAVCEK